jgi:hypothetical protein
MIRFVWILVILCTVCALPTNHVGMERMVHRLNDFTQHGRAHSSLQHEVVIAVKQRNLDVLEGLLMERSTPGTSTYQQWLSFEEVSIV